MFGCGCQVQGGESGASRRGLPKCVWVSLEGVDFCQTLSLESVYVNSKESLGRYFREFTYVSCHVSCVIGGFVLCIFGERICVLPACPPSVSSQRVLPACSSSVAFSVAFQRAPSSVLFQRVLPACPPSVSSQRSSSVAFQRASSVASSSSSVSSQRVLQRAFVPHVQEVPWCRIILLRFSSAVQRLDLICIVFTTQCSTQETPPNSSTIFKHAYIRTSREYATREHGSTFVARRFSHGYVDLDLTFVHRLSPQPPSLAQASPRPRQPPQSALIRPPRRIGVAVLRAPFVQCGGVLETSLDTSATARAAGRSLCPETGPLVDQAPNGSFGSLSPSPPLTHAGPLARRWHPTSPCPGRESRPARGAVPDGPGGRLCRRRQGRPPPRPPGLFVTAASAATLEASNLKAWQALYTATGGDAWTCASTIEIQRLHRAN